MRSQFKDCYNCAIETMQVLNKIYNHLSLSSFVCLRRKSSNISHPCLSIYLNYYANFTFELVSKWYLPFTIFKAL